MTRLVHKDAPGHFEPLTADQEAVFRSLGWTDAPKSSKPGPASDRPTRTASVPADSERK